MTQIGADEGPEQLDRIYMIYKIERSRTEQFKDQKQERLTSGSFALVPSIPYLLTVQSLPSLTLNLKNPVNPVQLLWTFICENLRHLRTERWTSA